ncbi:MAG: hypothetical protein ACYCQJ_05365 [Nitrososphaerales archaeon]
MAASDNDQAPSHQESITYNLPIRILTLSAKSEERFPVRKTDWHAIRRRISSIDHSPDPLQIIYSILFGSAITLPFSILSLITSRGVAPWIIPAYVSGFFALLSVGIICLVLSRRYGKNATSLANDVCSDMDNIEKSFENPDDPSSPPSGRP